MSWFLRLSLARLRDLENLRLRHTRRSSPHCNNCARPACISEALEGRTLLSVGGIPTVPVPAAHWTFDEGAGETAGDSSGNGHSGTLGSGVSWTAGNVGTGAISLNGSATGVVTVPGPVVNTAGSFTASAWVDLASVSGYETVVSIAGTNVAGFYLGLRADTGTFSFARLASDADGTATVVAAASAPVAGTWYHLVGVDDAVAGTLTLYVDGQSMGSTAYSGGWAATGNTLIGHGFYSGQQVDYVDGSIDDVEMFSSALSGAQVAALDQPAAYSFDDGTGTTAADITGHGHTLMLGAGASWAAGRIGSNSLAVNGSASGNATYAGPVLDTALPFSVSAWVNLSSTSGYQTFVSIDGTNTSGFYLQLRGDTGKFAFTRLAYDSDAAPAYHADAIDAPQAGVWYSLIGVNDVADGELLLYVNGVLQSSVAYGGGWQASGATVVGGGLFGGTRVDFSDGEIDDVHFYDSPLSAGDAAFIGTAGNSTITIDTDSTGATVSSDLFGAFMEDINYGGEGGIYNDEVQNSGFNNSADPLDGWSAVASSGVSASLGSDTTTGPSSALPESGKLVVGSGVSASARVGIANSGYFGVAVAPSTAYTVNFAAKATAGFTGPLTVDLESTTGTVFATATIPRLSTAWAYYTATLTTGVNTPTTSTNLLVLSTTSSSANGATLWFGATYLYPPSYDDQANNLRIDLMQMLAAMKPAVFRVPGGNYLEGDDYASHFEWSNTIGPVEDRPGHFNSAWGYWSSDGMGLDEYLQMAEEVGASPILAVYAGYTLDGSSDTGATLQNDVTDAVNELHYVLDPDTTTWGAERAANGHPAPYNVQYVEIGNEDFFSSTYATRYPLFYNAIHAAFPALKIIATSTDTGGSPYDVLDEHFYNTPQWFEANSDYFDDVSRSGSSVFVGEWASDEGSPTNDMDSALGDTCWLMGLERNSDLVTMESYAPLWSNVNGSQWTPDLIGFDGTSSYGSPSYYAQVMLANNHGTTVVSDDVEGAGGLQVLVTRTGDTYYVTVVNTLGTTNTATVDVNGVTAVSSTGTEISLVGDSTSETNSISDPTAIVPVTSMVSGLGANFTQAFPGYSITVLKFTTNNAPGIVNPAAVSASPVTGTTAKLSVLGADPTGTESDLTYTWAAVGAPAGAVLFSANDSNAAKNVTATFAEAGTYLLQVTVSNAAGVTTSSTVEATVIATPATISVAPVSSAMGPGATDAVAATVKDQFGNLVSPAMLNWSVTGAANEVTRIPGENTVMFIAGQVGGSYGITATINGTSVSSRAAITIRQITATALAPDFTGTANASMSLEFTATVSGGVPNGEMVTLEDGSNGNAVVATAALSGGIAVFTVPAGTLLAGTHALLAVYAGDSSFAGSSSAPLRQAIQLVVIGEQVNGNMAALIGAQRSMVDSVVFTFSEAVSIGSAGAFNLAVAAGQSGTVPTLAWTALDPGVGGASAQWVVSFSGAGVVGNSIADGEYTLSLAASAATNSAGIAAAAANTTFERLFGDLSGDGAVNFSDLLQMSRAYGSNQSSSAYVAALDYDDNGQINFIDLLEFSQRYGQTYTF